MNTSSLKTPKKTQRSNPGKIVSGAGVYENDLSVETACTNSSQNIIFRDWSSSASNPRDSRNRARFTLILSGYPEHCIFLLTLPSFPSKLMTDPTSDNFWHDASHFPAVGFRSPGWP